MPPEAGEEAVNLIRRIRKTLKCTNEKEKPLSAEGAFLLDDQT